jgi:hypothetical protein
MSKRFIGARQTTLAREVELSGTGVHSGAPVSINLHPAESDVGFRFLVSRRGRIVADIPADVKSVKNLTLCTVIGDDAGVTVGTVEHLLAALRGLGVDNCYIEIASLSRFSSRCAFKTVIATVNSRQATASTSTLKLNSQRRSLAVSVSRLN